MINFTPHIDYNLALEKEKEREYLRKKEGIKATEEDQEEIVLEEKGDESYQVKGSATTKTKETEEK